MPINLYDRLVKGWSGTRGIVQASDVETSNDGDAQTDLDNLGQSILAWKFNSSVTDASNPGSTFLALNNAAKDNATIVSFNTTSGIDSARFDEALTRLGTGDGIFIQGRAATNVSIFYRVTGPATLDGTKVNVPVVRERDQGGEFTNNALLNVTFFPRGANLSLQLQAITVDATSSSTFASSMSGVTVSKGHAFQVTTAGEPFENQTVLAKVGDWLVAEEDASSLTDVTKWTILRAATSIPLPSVVSAQFLGQVSLSNTLFNFSNLVQVLQRNLANVTLPVNAAYDSIARVLFGGASIETTAGSDTVEYAEGYSQAIDYRDNAAGSLNDATHYIDTDAGMSVSSNATSSTISYALGTTFQRLVAVQLQLNSGNSGTGAMLVLLTAPGGAEREFMHVTTENKIEIDQDPESESGTHATVQDQAGDVVIDDGSWLILEFVPSPGGLLDNWNVIPAILKADGTRIQCNDITVDLGGLSAEDLGISRSSAQRGQVLQYKTVQLPGYLRHNQLGSLWDHVDEKWAFGFARLFSSGSEALVNIVTKLKGPIESTIGVPPPTAPNAGRIARINAAGDAYEIVELSRNITATAIGGTGNSVLTLPTDYTDFDQLSYGVIEDGGQTRLHTISVTYLENTASIATLRVSGNDTMAWDRANRTLTLHETADTWVYATLQIPKVKLA